MSNRVDLAFPYIATCRDPDCVWHNKPARFEDYLQRQIAVGEHRLSTGHRIDFTTATGGPTVGHENDCPECKSDKHRNCTGWAIDEDTDNVVACECAEGGHL
jgi:hypothetical protein